MARFTSSPRTAVYRCMRRCRSQRAVTRRRHGRCIKRLQTAGIRVHGIDLSKERSDEALTVRERCVDRGGVRARRVPGNVAKAAVEEVAVAVTVGGRERRSRVVEHRVVRAQRRLQQRSDRESSTSPWAEADYRLFRRGSRSGSPITCRIYQTGYLS